MKVVLSAKACNQLETLLKYLELKWSVQTRRKFQKRLDLFIKAIKTMPNSLSGISYLSELQKMCGDTANINILYSFR